MKKIAVLICAVAIAATAIAQDWQTTDLKWGSNFGEAQNRVQAAFEPSPVVNVFEKIPAKANKAMSIG